MEYIQGSWGPNMEKRSHDYEVGLTVTIANIWSVVSALSSTPGLELHFWDIRRAGTSRRAGPCLSCDEASTPRWVSVGHSFHRVTLFRRGPLVRSKQNETKSILFLPFVVLAFIVGHFRHTEVQRRTYLFWLEAYGILVPQPWSEPRPLAVSAKC